MTPTSASSRRFGRFSGAILTALLFAHVGTSSAEVAVKSGEKVAFLGDSITSQGTANAAGYVKLVIAGLTANGITTTLVPAGVSGNTSFDMLNRLDRDVLSKKPQWMTLSCGVNDVWHGKTGVALNEAQAAEPLFAGQPPRGTYEKNITEIVDKAQAAGVKVVVLTATVIQENLTNDLNKKLEPYNDFLRKLAKEKHLPLADLNVQMQERIKTANTPGKNAFTVDGVHMNTEGNKMMATGILQAFGLDAAQLKKAQEAWAPMEAQAVEDKKKADEARAKQAAEKAAAAAAAKTATPAPGAPAPK
jgi:lysophospholipase L1-like esterase